VLTFPILNPPPPWPRFSTHVELWHGCLEAQAVNIQTHGVDPTRGAHAADFGRGFYTTTLRWQAEEWARKRYIDTLTKIMRIGGPLPTPPAIIRFRVPLTALAPLQSLSFVRGEHDEERFWSLVHHCRRSPDRPHPPHDHLYPNAAAPGWYDVVMGPVAAFWEQRVAMVGSDQLSFHTDAAATVLNSLLGGPDFGIHVLPVPVSRGTP
jgi:hypothetical protein